MVHKVPGLFQFQIKESGFENQVSKKNCGFPQKFPVQLIRRLRFVIISTGKKCGQAQKFCEVLYAVCKKTVHGPVDT